ncbi:single-stranded DNA-binding protein [Luteibaculum oceani]|uniref:Single-stranded DNA-binding protein n=1 Tax=Luteibaculum oceani TaxID=1294296 RepID=A0A5C6VB33_9FLAO|nr:single-stranded DNA-binding protein [Luteibaculum oceani]TXC81811.1 single-stranded DNA-binding protein [Luteibaculum oceani]
MAGVNKVILIGNLGKDPEVRTLSNGSKLAKFSLATNESYKTKDGNWNDRTEWHNITMWRNLAERAEKNLTKGTQIYVEGKLRNNSYQDQEGQTRYITEVEVEYFTILGNRNQDGNQSPKPSNESAPVAEAVEVTEVSEDDDLPF